MENASSIVSSVEVGKNKLQFRILLAKICRTGCTKWCEIHRYSPVLISARSTTCVVVYLMLKYDWTAMEALSHIRLYRPVEVCGLFDFGGINGWF